MPEAALHGVGAVSAAVAGGVAGGAVVEGAGGAFRVVALAAVAEGGVVLEIHGVEVGGPSRHSLQVGEDRHVEAPAGASGGRYAWRYLNHSCDPNARIEGMTLVAVRAIAAGEEVTFDYNTTEWLMAAPFACGCGRCGGAPIAGFARLTPAAQRSLWPRLAEHLRRRWTAEQDRRARREPGR